jgi:hypothetical protein
VTRPSRYAGRIACAFVFLVAFLFPITGSTFMNNQEIRARLVLEAYRRSYPDRIDSIEFRDGDWTVSVAGSRFYWANGRLMPEKERASWAKHLPYVFYAYPDRIRDPRTYSEAYVETLRAEGEAEARISGEDHHNGFRAALYGSSSRAGAERQLVKVSLFSRSVSVHRMVADAVRRVDARVARIAERDPETAAFLKNIGPMGGYNWREIRGTTRRSFHSWGLAIDIQPRKLGSQVIFWEWERQRNPDWMLVPPERRWRPPEAVVEAFEAEGFAWGGKWELYDPMHFEYRPELFEMNKVLATLGGNDAGGGRTPGGS